MSYDVKRRLRTFSTAVALGVSLAGCSTFDDIFGGPGKTPLPGERLSVMATDRGVEADPRLAQLDVRLPPPVENNAWPQPGALPNHAPQHLAASGFSVAWRSSVGSGSSRSGRVTSSPIIADGRVFTVDAGTQLIATDATSGSRLWSFDFEPAKEGAGGNGGGVAYDRGRLYLATGYAQIVALEASDAKELWRQTLTAPLRAGPTVGAGRVFAISIDNQVHALDIDSGRRQWAHSGITETAGFYGTSSPALEGNTVIVAFSSGELFALRTDNGRVLWNDSLAGALRADPISSLADIRGLPVIDRGQVFAASNAGRIVSIDLRSGGRIWDQNIGSVTTPWLAGDFIFLTTVDSELVCLTRRDGRVRWVTQLQRYRDEKTKRDRIVWTGPVLAGGKLFLANSRGDGLTVAPETGEIIDRISLRSPVFVSPAVANGTVYVLTDDADLLALR